VNAPDTLKSNPAEAAEKGAVVARAQKPHCILSRWTHVRKALRLVVFLVLACPSAVLAEDVDHDAYRLSPGDRITVTVFGQPELSGDILIDGAGTITIPLTDRIDVNALTLLECEKRIAERLADGILRKPAVSVRVAELRPLYVLGDVRQPGAYPFRYGSTVLSAVSLAGGFGPGELLRNTAVSEYLAAEQHVRELSLQKSTLLVRKARLQAQRDGNASFSPPDPIAATHNKETTQIVANEHDIFSTQAAILRSEIDLLRSQKPHLQEQIEADNEQGIAGKKQLDMIRQQIDRYGNLVKQGLGTQNNDFQYRLLEANQEAAVWRLLSDVSRLQVQSGDLEFKIQQVEAAFKRQVSLELQQTRDRLSELEVTLPAAIRIRDVKMQLAGGAASEGAKHLINITRLRNGRAVVMDANETTTVEPGDVIDIKNDLLRLAPPAEAAADDSSRLAPGNTEGARAPDIVGTITPVAVPR
jgi:polysaccharide biosynthesis/export protein